MQPLIVLKLGGSVLRSEESLPDLVHEIYRWRRAGHGVVAVVSALAGATDAWLRRSAEIQSEADPHTVAAFVANGELQSASLLGLYLDRSGVPASVLSPSALRLVAEGAASAASPVTVDRSRLRAALERDEVVLVPGFVAEDTSGRSVLLGRGGSDLTALFLAAELDRCRCRLIKDVDGLYVSDPAAPGTPPPRFEQASWDDALATDGTILQHRAVRFARQHRLAFEVSALGAAASTRVGTGPIRFASGDVVSSSRMRVALLGLGTVGGGVWHRLRSRPDLFEVVRVAVRRPARALRAGVPAELLTRDVLEAVSDADVVVETIGGLSDARRAVEKALRNGAHVVTANKSLLAAAGEPLSALARRAGRRLLCSAAVGGSVPVLERLGRRSDLVGVRGVLNGTASFVLERLARGEGLPRALDAARQRGLTEADPQRDLRGHDAAEKLVLIARAAGRHLALDACSLEAITMDAEERFCELASEGRTLRQVATLELGHRDVTGRVVLEALERDDPLARGRQEHNVVCFEHRNGRREVIAGRGAGRWPTVESVLGDLFELVRAEAARTGEPCSRMTMPVSR